MTVRLPRGGSEDGAAAVEFALISSILFVTLFAILQYGLYFNDSLNVRQGVREAARMGVVKSFPACGSTSSDWDTLRCNTKKQIGALTGDAVIAVNAPQGWERGKPLVVCAMVASSTSTGILPMPNSGVVISKVEMSIEKNGAPSGAKGYDTPPSGQTWPEGCK